MVKRPTMGLPSENRVDIMRFVKILTPIFLLIGLLCSFNMFTNKPADSWTGVSYESEMRIESLNEMNLGYDYIFVNGNETQLGISVAVYNSAGEEISSTDPILVPIVRSKLTQLRGEFLTSKSSGGVQVQPEFNGEYNIII